MPTPKRPPVPYQLTIDDVLRAKAAEARREAAEVREAQKARKAAAKGQPLPLEGL